LSKSPPDTRVIMRRGVGNALERKLRREDVGLYDPRMLQRRRIRPALFQLGQIVATAGFIETMNRKGIAPLKTAVPPCLRRLGCPGDHDKAVNGDALKQDGHIFSAYATDHGML
jgi:hypothetical protein